ncbi:beta-mannosidase [Phyllobacterium sp. YR620]|uniref:glycoside hydrolase family 2 protein n=1 Tax=Phyllobacterium sp. YR620 TaxID=1881066 RepID=UPI00088D4DB9|nr:sugar-binding domain-containing protein [Phyllobacterium sp. YR620]SDP81772.1 beta-mannosidase [Phyllobacterium sp. YR620]
MDTTRRRFLTQGAILVAGGIVSACDKDNAKPVAETTFETPAAPPTTPPVTPTVELPIELPPVVPEAPMKSMAGTRVLNGGWTFQDAKNVPEIIPAGDISKEDYSAEKWQTAAVPGTVLTSMVNNGVYPEPLYRQIVTKLIPDTLKDSDYWYRAAIEIPVLEAGQRFWLRFDGINYLADIWLNGQSVGRIEGAFKRGYFDVTDIIKDKPGQNAFLAVKVYKLEFTEGPSLPSFKSGVTRGGRNGGRTGTTLRNGPTFFCVAGWDWVPTIPDRCIGIWQPVYSFTTGALRITDVRIDPVIADDLTIADLAIDVTLVNHGGSEKAGVIAGRIGDIEFKHAIELPADGQAKTVTLTSTDLPQLLLKNPKLWWPNGYGDPYLYPVSIRVDVGDTTSDVRELKYGIRKIQYVRPRGANNDLGITINNLPILVMGGNWGLDEALKRVPRERVFNAVRLHRDANLNLIRNWNGQSTSKDFFEACDEYGILVWQDFFYSTEGYGSSGTYNVDRYLDNVRDVITNYRNHASILLWCGGNEGKPENQKLVDGLDKLVAELDPKRECLTSSAGDTNEQYAGSKLDGYSSGGPYHWVAPKSHFSTVTSDSSMPFHNEMGSYSIPTLEFVQSMLPEQSWQCPDDYWADRDINANGGNGNGSSGGGIFGATAGRYGKLANLADFVRKAQLMNYECIKAIYEAHAVNFGPITPTVTSTSMGVIKWMSHPAQPSFVWQMYSYDMEQHSSFFAVKNGSKRVNVVMNALTRIVNVVNQSAERVKGSVDISVYNLDGSLVVRTVQNVSPVAAASAAKIIDISAKIAAATSAVCFVSLKFSNSVGQVLAENFYWYQKNNADKDYTSMETIPLAAPSIAARRVEEKDGKAKIAVAVENAGTAIAVMVHLQLFDRKTNKRILPAFFSDNYLNLLPGVKREVTIEVPLQEGVTYDFGVRVDGFNFGPDAKLDASGSVPVVRNENALAIAPSPGITFNNCAAPQ